LCSHYTYSKNEARLRLRDKILVYGAVLRVNIRPTDFGRVRAERATGPPTNCSLPARVVFW
jgi:hypothetical protein